MNPNAAIFEAREATPRHHPIERIAPLALLTFSARKAISPTRARRWHEPIASRDTPHEKDES